MGCCWVQKGAVDLTACLPTSPCLLQSASAPLCPLTPPSGLAPLKLSPIAKLKALGDLDLGMPDSPCTPQGAGIPFAVPAAPPPPKLLGAWVPAS